MRRVRDPGNDATATTSGWSGDAAGLALQAARRDPAAWSHLFDCHFRTVFTYLRHRLPGLAEAEDLAAQVFEIGYSRAHTFDYRGVPIEAWLLGIARNLARDHMRRVAQRGIPLPVEEETLGAVDEGRYDADLRQDIRTAMQALTEDQQVVITLRFFLDRSVADTAIAMERSEDAVKLLQRRALAALQRQLGAAYRQEGS